MRKFARWVLLILLSLSLAVVSAWLLSRVLGPTAEQKAALAMLGEKGPPTGRNAFAALWLLAYDAPEDRQAAIVAEDVQRFGALPPPQSVTFTETDAFQSVAAKHFASLTPPAQDWGKFCTSRTTGCLGKIRDDRRGYAALLARNARLIERATGLRQYGHYRNALPVRPDLPFPPFQYAIAPLTRHAFDFVEGRHDAALSGICEDVAAWRRIGASADSLIARMIGIAYATDGYARLFADMLAELPARHPLPAVCQLAFAVPGMEEGLVCEAMKGEAQYIGSSMKMLERVGAPVGGRIDDALFPVLYSAEMTVARMAPAQALACSDAVRRAVAADAPVKSEAAASRGLGFDCLGNYAGCMIAADAGSDGDAYTPYMRRAQDYMARLQLMATLLWLREGAGDGRPVGQRWRERPQALMAPGHRFELVEGGKSLRMKQFDDSREPYWQVPLAAP